MSRLWCWNMCNLLSQAHMWPQGWNKTAAFLSEQTTHSSICGEKGIKVSVRSLSCIYFWVGQIVVVLLVPWFLTGPDPCRWDTSWHEASRGSRWRCVHRARTECLSSCLSTPYTPPATRCCCSETGCGCPPGRWNIENKTTVCESRRDYRLTENKENRGRQRETKKGTEGGNGKKRKQSSTWNIFTKERKSIRSSDDSPEMVLSSFFLFQVLLQSVGAWTYFKAPNTFLWVHPFHPRV